MSSSFSSKILAIGSILSLSAFAQTPLPAPAANPTSAAPATIPTPELPALRVSVTQVSESRSLTGTGRITLQLGVSGEGLPPNAQVRQVVVTKAVDNQDRLIPPLPGGMSPISTMSLGQPNPNPVLRATASLGGAQRAAESLKFVEGTIEIYLPTETNGSVIRIKNVKSHPGQVENPVLSKHGIAFHFLSNKASSDEAKAMMGTMAANVSVEPNGVTTLGYYYRDPASRLAGYQLQDANGTMIRTGGGGGWGSSGASYSSATLTAPLPDDAQLVLYIATPEATKTVPFRVEDVMLP